MKLKWSKYQAVPEVLAFVLSNGERQYNVCLNASASGSLAEIAKSAFSSSIHESIKISSYTPEKRWINRLENGVHARISSRRDVAEGEVTKQEACPGGQVFDGKTQTKILECFRVVSKESQ